jgi:hypothetical protein
MKLCKYVNIEGLNDIINNARLKVNGLNGFNDPFESMAYIDNDLTFELFEKELEKEDIRKTIYHELARNSMSYEKFIDSLKNLLERRRLYEWFSKHPSSSPEKMKDLVNMVEKYFKVLCLADFKNNSFNEMLLWSHYADGHKGARVVFETDNIGLSGKTLKDVDYKNERYKISRCDLFKNQFDPESRFLFDEYTASIYIKAEPWKYEREYRWVINKDKCISKKDYLFWGPIRYFVKFPGESIVGVDFGYRISETVIKEIMSISKNKEFQNIKFRKAAISEREFSLNYNEL